MNNKKSKLSFGNKDVAKAINDLAILMETKGTFDNTSINELDKLAQQCEELKRIVKKVQLDKINKSPLDFSKY